MRTSIRSLSDMAVHYLLFGISVALAGVCAILLMYVAERQVKAAIVDRAAMETIAANPNPVIVCRNGTIEIVNQAAEVALGVHRNSLIGKNAAEVLVPEEYRKRHLAAIAKLQSIPYGTSGHGNYIMPATNAYNGNPEQWLVTAQYYRRSDTGDLMTIARFVNFVIDEQEWVDIKTGSRYTVQWSLSPLESEQRKLESE